MTTHSNIIPFPKVIANKNCYVSTISWPSALVCGFKCHCFSHSKKNELHCCCSSCISGKMLAWGVPNRTLKGILFSSVKKYISFAPSTSDEWSSFFLMKVERSLEELKTHTHRAYLYILLPNYCVYITAFDFISIYLLKIFSSFLWRWCSK